MLFSLDRAESDQNYEDYVAIGEKLRFGKEHSTNTD